MNAAEVLRNVERLLADESKKSWEMRRVYKELGIFDWWKDKLTVSDMKAMQSFMREAILLGYDGRVAFKVGASGCSNGMWAYTEESVEGDAPDSDYLYRSFTPDYTEWAFTLGDEAGSGLKSVENLELAFMQARRRIRERRA